ncbi:DMT family transporter [Streptomyces albidochromogenes]|uniref:DMT family transporter n=1 Tax=Streptomyces albidochromogenes TaxID=329524 RepID=UPI001FCCAFE4|nr:EamA family transporter [Streptomyces albidochromogenes]
MRQGMFYVATAATAWGTGGAVAAVLYDMGGIGPGAASFWRFLGGLALLLTLRALWRRRRSAPGDSLVRCLLRGKGRVVATGFGLAVYQTAYFAAVQQAGLTVATMVTLGSGPVLVAVGSRLLLDERIGRAGVLAVVSGVLGLGLLMCGTDQSTGPNPLLGLGYAVLSAVGYAGVTLLGRASGRRREGGAFDAMVVAFAIGTVCLFPLALVEGWLPGTGHLFWTVASIGYLGLIPTALAYTLFFAGLSVVKATTASVIALVEPLTAAVIGVVLLGDRLNPVVVTGMVLLMGAVLCLSGRSTAKSLSPR